MLSSYRKCSLLAALMFSALLQPIVFAQRCSGTPGCARTSSTAASVSGVAALSGQYAFQLNGTLTTPGIASRATAAIGSFYADGHGYILTGEVDFTSAAQTMQALGVNGSYTLDSDTGIGTLTLTSTPWTATFAIYTTGGGLPSYTSGSLVETDGGPVVSSGSFYQQSASVFAAYDVYGYWRAALRGETFVTEGTPSPIFVSGNVSFPEGYPVELVTSLTMRVGSGTPEILSTTLSTGYLGNYPITFTFGRMPIWVVDGGIGNPLNLVAYIVDDQHILVMSTDPPRVNPLISGTMTRDSIPGQ